MNRSVFDDPITLEVVWGRLVTLADEMQTVLRRTAFSTVVSTGNDLGCEIMDARAWSVAHAVTSNPTFNLTLPHLTAVLLRTFPAETLREGDVLFTNDPWIGAGHLPDVAVVTPFFKHGKVVGFAGSIAHVSDIGGLLNQSEARSVYEEGVYFPPLKLYDAGVRNEAVFATLRGSVRAPELVIGDINAIVTANSVAAAHTVDLLDEYGLDDLQQLSDAVQARAEKAMRATVEALPDGTYPFELTFDELDGSMTLGVELVVAGSELLVDYVRVPPQHPHGGINSTLTFTTARTTYALNCLLTPQIPSNQGLFRPITVRAPEGSVLNPVYPASVNDRTKVGWHVIPLVQGALAGVLSIPAAGGFKSSLRLIGTGPHDVAVSSLAFAGGGLGANPAGDGVDAICYPTSSSSIPVEIYETTTGARVTRKELAPGTAGAGRFRGGHGQLVTLLAPEDTEHRLTLAAGCHQQSHPPFGLTGGAAARPTEVSLDGVVVPVSETAARLGALPFDRTAPTVTLRTAGGGGHGSPAERPAHLVLRDVRDELLTPEEALAVYGVTVDLEELTATRSPEHAAS
ncbi:hydantoinase B/oxoprolinase family protein [Amycolatopsis rhabdoformis]|uniref:Hydantoinase B/oxoprolinase family protein n=1 Tax=Amycolatopsis rhabdoformis TaxID=1448059 RepID=A0ABZ1IID3_9PSEU|nr:hydantoinase B/oxoprolinase family protein [Amycolatopsis rhabdoformis]WSE34152.1 hydantoinase B/oxoprolinase family protein [Amycolatopsis rhabdoformis]